MGIVDEYFHTLINPQILGPRKFWRVIDCFTRAYLLLAREIIDPKCDEVKFYKNMLEKPNDTFNIICQTIDYDARFKNDGYYQVLKRMTKDKSQINIVSTNYTPCCSIITNRDDIIHIHGRMDLFEDPYEWRVVSAAEAQKNNELGEDRRLLFPYLSIQSGVKPIVEKNQITEHIIVVGYNINCDDNHINSILRNAVVEKKDVKILVYESGRTIPDLDADIRGRLRLEGADSNLNCIKITRINSLHIFEDQLR